MQLWLYLHFPQLQLDALQAQQAQNPLPLVIWDQQQHQVIQLNAAAHAAGIKTGMKLASAAALSADLQVLPHQPRVEQDLLLSVAEALYLVSADIHLATPQGIALRVQPMLQLYGGLNPYWQAIVQQLAPFKLSYQYATGPSLLGAKLLALNAINSISADQAQLKQALMQCPLIHSELEQRVQTQLTRVGIRRLGELLAIPQAELSKRFDISVINYLGRVIGQLKHPVDFFHPPETFQRYWEVLYEIQQIQGLMWPLQQLLSALEQFLRLRDSNCMQLQLSLYFREQAPQHLKVGSQQGEYRVQRWLALLELQLQRLQLPAPVYGLALEVDKIERRQPDADDLFAKRQSQLSQLQLLSLLQAKLGEDCLYRPGFADDYRPEKAAQYQPLGQAAKVTAGKSLAMRPSFLLQQPEPLQEPVTVLHGPERLQAGWWDEQMITRDYYIARSATGQWLWVFKTPKKHWYVQGVFS